MQLHAHLGRSTTDVQSVFLLLCFRLPHNIGVCVCVCVCVCVRVCVRVFVFACVRICEAAHQLSCLPAD